MVTPPFLSLARKVKLLVINVRGFEIAIQIIQSEALSRHEYLVVELGAGPWINLG